LGRFQGGYFGISKELIMTKTILVSLAVLTLATSSAFAAQRTYHRQATNAYASMPAATAPAPAAPVMWMGGVSSGDRELYFKNLRDSGYNTQKNFNSSGNVATQ
jgi:hypothetical protein